MATCSSNVLLGVCDAPCSDLFLSPYENKIGGYPDFFPTSSLSSLPRCGNCGGSLRLLVQIYCPLEDSVNHRLLHLYCCTVCLQRNEGWLALRSELRDTSATTNCSPETIPTNTRLTSDSTSEAEPLSREQDEWCSGADDWGEEVAKFQSEYDVRPNGELWHSRNFDASDSKIPKEPECLECLMQGLDSVRLTENRATVESTSLSFRGPYFKAFYLNVIEEPLSSTLDHGGDLQQQAEKLLQRYTRENQDYFDKEHLSTAAKNEKRSPSEFPVGQCIVGERETSGGCERYEKVVAKHGDRTFQNFKKTLSRCPNQVLRYCWKGEPLVISDRQQTPNEVMCKSCSAPAVFEFQLMPHLVYILQQNHAGTVESGSVEFETVMVYSCSKSCWSGGKDCGFKEETVFVVADPESQTLNSLFRDVAREKL